MSGRGAVRQYLAEVTRHVHEALHHDPVLAVLSAPGLSAPQYRAALGVFEVFYRAVEAERARHGAYAFFALEAECGALRVDVGAPGAVAAYRVTDRMALLGALYVAHGAAFGRGTFRANVTSALADMPHAFVRLPARPQRWRALIEMLDMAGQDPQARTHIAAGANGAFGLVQSLAHDSHISGKQVELA